MPKSNYSLPHEKIQRELATIKVEVNHIKKQVKDLSTEQKKLSAYANMGKGGLKVLIWVGYIIAGVIGFFIGHKI
jgi:hypothetical protein|tara:strand:+ start:327 stop:551 length:225 start_codon:yes stop_codon:yes gene_type:complete